MRLPSSDSIHASKRSSSSTGVMWRYRTVETAGDARVADVALGRAEDVVEQPRDEPAIAPCGRAPSMGQVQVTWPTFTRCRRGAPRR